MRITPHKILAWGSLVGALGSCAAPRTQIIVVVDTDLVVPAEVGSLRVTVLDPNGNESEVRAITLAGHAVEQCADSATRYCVPLSFLLVPKERRPESSPVEVTVDGVEGTDALGGRVRVSVRSRLAFSPGRTLRLPVFLSRSCEQIVCAAGQTCVEDGVCVPIERPIGVTEIDPRTGMSLDVAIVDASEPLDVRSRRRDSGTDSGSAMDAADSARFDSSFDTGRDSARDSARDSGRGDAPVESPDAAFDDVSGDACLTHQAWCGSRCVNTQSSELHCGRCNNRCVAPALCVRGECR